VKVSVVVMGYQGCLSDVRVFKDPKAAAQALADYVGMPAESWFHLLEESGEYPDENYDPTTIYEVEVEGEEEEDAD
jgi:hypothetical protein